jgi:uncharacterized protein (DUF2267 family)
VTHEDFIGEVQTRGHLESRDAAATAIRATLVTLAEQLEHAVARNLAAQLPSEIARYLIVDESLDFPPMTLDQFVRHVASREASLARVAAALLHVRIVIEVLYESTCGGIMDKVRKTVPAELEALFESAVMNHRAA